MPYIVQAPQASAAVNYDHNALLEYKGYGEAMYETVVEQTTFVSGQYTENKQYVKDSIGQIKDYANFWLNEQGNLKDACNGLQIFTKHCLGEMVSTAGGYALTVGDFVKNLFTDKQDDDETREFLDYQSVYGYCFDFSAPSISFNRKAGCSATVTMPDGYTFKMGLYTSGIGVSYTTNPNKVFAYAGNNSTRAFLPDEFNTPSEAINKASELRESFNSIYSTAVRAGIKIDVTLDGSLIQKPILETPQRNFTNYIKDNPVQIQTPTPKAYLNCPDGTRIDMAINGSTFLDANGQVMNVNTDGTAEVSTQICNLGWEKQQVDYVDDKAAITDPDGNWLDIVSGELLECVLLEKCEVTPPSEIEPIDNSLIEYVKNAYEYATSVLKTATDGLKSLGNGAKELTALFGVFFSWLPREMVVLMSSGLALMIGLRLFRK